MSKRVYLVFFSLIISCIGYGQERGLQYYIDKGISNNPLLNDLNNQALSTRIDSQQLKSLYRPQVSLTSNNFYAPVINGYGYDAAITNIGSYSSLVNVDQQFVGKRNLKTQYETVKLQVDSIGNEKKLTEQDLKRNITNQYITAYGDLQQLLYYTQVHVLITQEDSILKKLAENNVYRQTDYLTFLVTLQQQELQIKQLHIQFQTDLSTLNYLCGIYDTTGVVLATPDITVSDATDAVTSIFYHKYFVDSLLLSNSVSLLNYSYRPKVNAFANAGYYSSLLYQPYKNFGAGIGLNLTMPIYDGHLRKQRSKKIALEQNTVSGYRDFFNMQYNQQLAQLRQQLRSTESMINDINEQIKYSEALINVNGKLLTTGDAKIPDFIIAINNYLTAKNLLTQNKISKLQIINQINYWNR